MAGSLPPGEFEAYRTALVERLRGENSTAQALNFWVLRNFYDPSKHTDFPDLLSFFAGVTQDEVATFAARTFVPEREVTTLVRVQPMSQLIFAAAALLLVFLTLRAVAWALTRPLTMPGILYVARFRMPVPLLIAAVVGFGGVGLIVGRLIVFAAQSLALAYVVTIDHYGAQLVFYGAMLIAAVVLFILYLSLFPRKIIVFPDHLRIKFLAYRSRIIKADDLLELTTRRVRQVWFRKDAFQCVPLAFGLVGPGIYIRPTKGRAYFFRTRNTEELINVLGGWRGSSVSSALVKKKPIARDPFEAAEHTADWIASIAPDTLPKIEESSASIAPHPLPGDRGAIGFHRPGPAPGDRGAIRFHRPGPAPGDRGAIRFHHPGPAPGNRGAIGFHHPGPASGDRGAIGFHRPGLAPGDRGAIGFHRPGPAPGRSRSHRLPSPRTRSRKIEEPPASIASLLLGSLAEDEEPPVPITSIAPDPTDSDENS